MVRTHPTPVTISGKAKAHDWALPVLLGLGLALVSVSLGLLVQWSLERPQDWRLRWTMEDESTEDQSLHLARLAQGAKLGLGKVGGGVHLPGPESIVVLDGWRVASQWTIELWVQALQPTTKLQLIAGSGQETESYGVGLSQGAFAAMHYDADGNRAWLSSGIRPATNSWHHVAATCSGSRVSIYVDGTLCASTNAGALPAGATSSTMHLGASHVQVADGVKTTQVFTGTLDHLSVYGRALSDAEIRALRRSLNISPPTRQLACDLLFSLSFALLFTAVFAGLAIRYRPRSPEEPRLQAVLGSYRTVFALLLIGLTSTGCLYFATSRECTARDNRRFHQLIVDFLDQFDTRTESYLQHLTALRGWLNNENDLTPEKWSLMMESMRFSQDFPGLCSVSFAPAVSAERLHEFERWAQKHIHTNYQVHRISETSERILISTSACSDCPTLLPVTLHTHVYRPGVLKTRKTTQLGRDLLDPNEPEFPLINPSTYPMVLSARKDQEASAGQLEELYTLNNAKPPIRGTRIFLGVFTTQSNLSRLGQSAIYSPPGQRKNLGVLVSSIDWQEFFDSALRAQKSEIGFMLYRPEGKQGAGRFIVAQSSPSLPPEGTSPLEATYQCRFYGRRLHFELRPLPSFFEHSERQWPLVIAVLGIALSVGVAALVFIQTRARVVEVATGQQLRASHEQLQHLLQDRERISRDLHDGTIQSIYAIGLGLKRTQKLIDQNPSLAHTQLGETIGELDLAISELRQFILSLEPNLASGESLTYALNALVSRCRRITPSTIELSVDDKFQADLSAYLSVHLLNLIREGLTNSIRHASARTIAIRLQQEASELRLQITDDGVGFDTELASSSGSGHRNMRARVQEVGGTLTISSANGSGTTILAILPMPGVTDGPSSPRAPL